MPFSNTPWLVVEIETSAEGISGNAQIELMQRENSPFWLPKKLDCVVSHCTFLTNYKDCLYLRIIILMRLIFFRSIGLASFLSRPRYVALKLAHGMNTVRSYTWPGSVCGGSSKSHS